MHTYIYKLYIYIYIYVCSDKEESIIVVWEYQCIHHTSMPYMYIYTHMIRTHIYIYKYS